MPILTKWAFRNKTAMIFSLILSLLLGIYSYFSIPMELMPSVDQPFITVSTIGNGIDAKTMSDEVTTPIEKALSNVNGKRDMSSKTGNGFSQLLLTFDSKSNIKDAKQEVQEAINSINLPQGVMKPFVTLLNTSQIPVGEIGLTFKNGEISNQVLNQVDQEIIPEFKKIKGVSNVGVFGGSNQQVELQLDQQKLAQYKISMQMLLGSLQIKNFAAAVGEQTIDGTSTTIKVMGKLDEMETLKNLQIAPGVHLKDIATVGVKRDTQTINHLNGKDFVFMMVQKDPSANAVDVGQSIKKVINKINDKYSSDMHAHIFLLFSDTILDSIYSMTREILTGAGFAALIIFLFLRNIKATLISIVSIPLSLCLTLLVLKFAGITLNTLTLGGVAVAVGRLVDDSIVVVENIYRRSQKEPISFDLIIQSVREVSSAVTSSTLTTIAVFLPIAFTSASFKGFVSDFAWTVTISLLASLLVALTVVPLMSSGLLKNRKQKEHKPSKRYISLLSWCLNHKLVPILTLVALLIGTFGLLNAVPRGSVDDDKTQFVIVDLQYPENISFEKAKESTLKLEKFISDQNEVKDVILQLGNNADAARFGQVDSNNKSELTIFLKDDQDPLRFIDTIRKQEKEYPGATLTAESFNMMNQKKTLLNLDVIGDEKKVNEATQKVVDLLKQTDGVKKVETNQEQKKQTYEIEVDTSKANAKEISMHLQSMLNGMPIGQMKLDGRDTPIVLNPIIQINKETDLNNFLISTQTGLVPLSSVAKIKKTEQPGSILAKDGRPYIQVTAQLDPAKAIDVVQTITKDIKQPPISSYENVEIQISGSAYQSSDDLKELSFVGIISIGAIFLIMLITLKSFRASFAILFAIPFALIGSLLGLSLTKNPVSLTSGLGMLMLAGIVVTNAIVLVDRIKQNEERMTIREAIVEAGSVRLRPILMTAFATVFAMIPLLNSHEQGFSLNLVSKDLAIAVIGGLTVSTFLTLIFVPVLYELFYFRKSKKQRLEMDVTQAL